MKTSGERRGFRVSLVAGRVLRTPAMQAGDKYGIKTANESEWLYTLSFPKIAIDTVVFSKGKEYVRP